MGDVAMTVPVLRSLLNAYPELKITLVSRKFFEPLFEGIPNLTFVAAEVNGKHKGILGILRLSKELKRIKLDAVADLHNVIRSIIIRYCLGLDGIPSAALDKGRGEKKRLTNAQGRTLSPLKSTHERYADVFRKLGFHLLLDDKVALIKKPFSEKLIQLTGKEPTQYIGIAPFAAFQGKEYPMVLMKEVIEGLSSLEKCKILLFGGGAREVKILEELESSFPNVINVAGKLDFANELALISNLDVMLSMDSGNGHLAANFGVPVVTLWGVTHPYAGFTPYLQPKENQLLSDRNTYPLIPTSVYGNKWPKSYENVMETIPSAKIIERIEQILHYTSS
jgi:ADP-heptose:LPS heptosyltransferase